MARKNYSEEFRRQAVDLYETTPGATVRGIADDLGIVRGTLRHWLEAYGTGKKTAADGTLTASPLKPRTTPSSPVRVEPLEQRVTRLEAENAALRAETTKLTTERIRAVHAEDNTCGAPRITAELNAQLGDSAPAGERVNHKRVARVMRLEGIRGYMKRRKVRTTIPEPSGQKYPDLLKRDFTAERPNERYVGDITYLPLADGTNLYLATVIDCYSRRLVGWAVADHMRTELVEDALKAAAATRGSLKGAVFHSDHGSVYCSKAYAQLCRKLGVTQSMGAVGSSADNALAGSFNATMKREVLQDAACWSDELACRRQVFRWLVRYNTKRRHSWCRYTSPVAFETGYTATLRPAA
ncbi:IS3 family transposase [Calidifontibacter indicus]|uniref:IS3 family transposase n=1 Tax=Calidifontibacter indicus TaxID=419650 RepID=UPI003D739AE5